MLFRPDIIFCPFLKQRVPDSIWRHHACLIVHPGIEGDRGPSSLDWAIKRGVAEWGVTLLQAAEEMDAGHIWGTATFPMREASKGGLYRREVTEHTVRLVLAALEQHKDHRSRPRALNYDDSTVRGRWNRAIRQEDRAIDWRQDSTESIVREINAADGAPGVLDEVADTPVYLYGARAAIGLHGRPGELIAKCHGAICRGTTDGAVWISHLKRATGATPGLGAIKLPATSVIGHAADALPHLETDVMGAAEIGCNEIRYYERGAVGYLHFDFYNGAMNSQDSSDQGGGPPYPLYPLLQRVGIQLESSHLEVREIRLLVLQRRVGVYEHIVCGNEASKRYDVILEGGLIVVAPRSSKVVRQIDISFLSRVREADRCGQDRNTRRNRQQCATLYIGAIHESSRHEEDRPLQESPARDGSDPRQRHQVHFVADIGATCDQRRIDAAVSCTFRHLPRNARRSL